MSCEPPFNGENLRHGYAEGFEVGYFICMYLI